MILNELYIYLCHLTAHRNLKQIYQRYNPYMAFETIFLRHKNGTTSKARRLRLTGLFQYILLDSFLCLLRSFEIIMIGAVLLATSVNDVYQESIRLV